MDNNQQYLGKWYKENADEGFDEINILEIEGDIARANNKNYSLAELKRSWKRANEIAADPFSMQQNVIPNELKSQPQENIVARQNEQYPALGDVGKTVTKTVEQSKVLLNGSASHQFIRSAIALTSADEKSELNVNVTFELPCSIEKIKTIAQQFNVKDSVVSEVLIEYMNVDQQSILTKISDAIANSLSSKEQDTTDPTFDGNE